MEFCNQNNIQETAANLSKEAIKIAAEDIRNETGLIVTTSSSSSTISRRSTPFEQEKNDDITLIEDHKDVWKIHSSEVSAFQMPPGATSTPLVNDNTANGKHYGEFENFDNKLSSNSSHSETIIDLSVKKTQNNENFNETKRTYVDDLFIEVSNSNSQTSSPILETNRSEASTSYRELPSKLSTSNLNDSINSFKSEDVLSEDIKYILKKYEDNENQNDNELSDKFENKSKHDFISDSQYGTLEKDLEEIETGLAAFRSPFSLSSNNQTSLSDTVNNILSKESPPRQAYEYLREAESLERSIELEKNNRSKTISPTSELASIQLTPISKVPFSGFQTTHSLLVRQLDRMEYENPLKNYKSSEDFPQNKEGILNHAYSDPTSLAERVKFLTERERKLREQEESLRRQKEKDNAKMRELQDKLNKHREEDYRRRIDIENDIEKSQSFDSEKESLIRLARKQEEDYKQRRRREFEEKETELSLKLDNLEREHIGKSSKGSDGYSEYSLSPTQSQRSSPSRPPPSNKSDLSDTIEKPLISARSIKSDVPKAPSDTTIESTHPGSDDFRPPPLPNWVFGSRTETSLSLNNGIYAKPFKVSDQLPLNNIDHLGTILEHSDVVEVEKNSFDNTTKWLNGHFEVINQSCSSNDSNDTVSVVEDELSSFVQNDENLEQSRTIPCNYQLHENKNGNNFKPLYVSENTEAIKSEWIVPTERNSLSISNKKLNDSIPDDDSRLTALEKLNKKRDDFSPTTRRLLKLLLEPPKSNEYSFDRHEYSRELMNLELNSPVEQLTSKTKSGKLSKTKKSDSVYSEKKFDSTTIYEKTKNLGTERHSETSEKTERSDIEIVLNSVNRSSRKSYDSSLSQDSTSTLTSIPEDSTLESSSTVNRRKHLTSDPKIIKLLLKIQRQKEKISRGKYLEEKRKEKILKLEELAMTESASKHGDLKTETSDCSTMVDDKDFEQTKKYKMEKFERLPSRHLPPPTEIKKTKDFVRKTPSFLKLKPVTYNTKLSKKKPGGISFFKKSRDIGINVPSPNRELLSEKRKYSEKSVQTSPTVSQQHNINNNWAPPADDFKENNQQASFIDSAWNLGNKLKDKSFTVLNAKKFKKYKISTCWEIEKPVKLSSSAILSKDDINNFRTLKNSRSTNIDECRTLKKSFDRNSQPVMSLQKAFELKKLTTLHNIEERNKFIKQRAEDRKLECLENMNDFKFQQLISKRETKYVNEDARIERLFRPRKRTVSLKEARKRSAIAYKSLPEITEKQLSERRKAESRTNKLKAEIFKRKVLCKVLNKKVAWNERI